MVLGDRSSHGIPMRWLCSQYFTRFEEKIFCRNILRDLKKIYFTRNILRELKKKVIKQNSKGRLKQGALSHAFSLLRLSSLKMGEKFHTNCDMANGNGIAGPCSCETPNVDVDL